MLNPKLLTVAALAAGLTLAAAASIGVAHETGKPAAKSDTGMMGGSGMTGMMGEMSRMMEGCNRMMQGMMQNMPASPGATTPEKKG